MPQGFDAPWNAIKPAHPKRRGFEIATPNARKPPLAGTLIGCQGF
jgi:hypothetical protein